ncbi:two component transcriptional regulator [Gottschalkia acidurici 9a]|uniref:Two component transcriptional regulator n=1 Tax=Gottschalkia acidurici (strain ATCC 7906 / DSM 604 / BCRC 14475 / CIP 104303 / KCTC 5404 / NCIMB 10678 / 9a) TaxID=1128398 RepID=K0B144_GOTA9|nr:response regulator transcription factor [Gottschalkia acidurici]AFS79738.1 two component transcriptional regulator [Gottschalkia acidurici 9a]
MGRLYKERKILIVDDEKELLEMVKDILLQEGYTNIVTASTVKEAIIQFEHSKPHLAILDVMLPDGEGYEICRYIRSKSDIPILFLTAKDEDEDLYKGLELGGDDYIIKPFLPKELLLRIIAILRRSYKEDEKSIVPIAGGIINFGKAQSIINGKVFPLTAKEHEILQILYRNKNYIVTIDNICQYIWGENYFGYENSLMAHIRRIREKIEVNPSSPVNLVTIKGLGYKLIIREDD